MAVASFVPRGIGRVPGYAPGSAVTFCATESHQRTPALLSVSPCCARGSLWCSRAGRAAELTSRCALRSNNCGKSEVEVGGVLRHPQPSRALRSSARTQGPWTAGNQTATRAIAALGPVLAPSPPGKAGMGRPPAAERSDGPCGSQSLCGCACVGVFAGWHERRCAHASLTDSPRLSERSCAAAK